MKSRAGPSDDGGIGMKCRNKFEPKTTKITPRRLRAMIVAIFIVSSFSFFRLTESFSFFAPTSFLAFVCFAQYHIACAAMLFRHDGVEKWNCGNAVTSWPYRSASRARRTEI